MLISRKEEKDIIYEDIVVLDIDSSFLVKDIKNRLHWAGFAIGSSVTLSGKG